MELYKRIRPKSLKSVLGNRATISRLALHLKNKDLPQTLLFVGPSGCGKTTVSRALAIEMGIGKCDYTELNAADNRGIDSMRELLKSMTYKPMNGSAKMYVIDEAHQLTKDAQNAALKSLEDSDPSTYVVLATTDPKGLLPTIRSRCQDFQFKPLARDEFSRLMSRCSAKVKKKLPQKTQTTIFQKSCGRPRESIQLFEAVYRLASTNEQIEAIDLAESSNDSVFRLYQMLIANKPDWRRASPLAKKLLESSDAETLRRQMMGISKQGMYQGNRRAFHLYRHMRESIYDSPEAGFIFACLATVNS